MDIGGHKLGGVAGLGGVRAGGGLKPTVTG